MSALLTLAFHNALPHAIQPANTDLGLHRLDAAVSAATASAAPLAAKPAKSLYHRWAMQAISTEPVIPLCSERHPNTKCVDDNGQECELCAPPSLAYITDYPDNSTYVTRSDCGAATLLSLLSVFNTPIVSLNDPPTSTYLPPKFAAPTSWMNAWCATELQKACADGEASHDYFTYAAGFTVPPAFAYDFYYCKYNGYLAPEVVAMKRNYSALYDYSVAKCAAVDKKYNVSKITMSDMMDVYQPLKGNPSKEQAEWIAAWTCAEGGPGGDISYCAHTFYDLSAHGVDPAEWPSTLANPPLTDKDGKITDAMLIGNATDPLSSCMYPDWYGETNKAWAGTDYEGTDDAKLWKCPSKYSYRAPK